MVEVVSYLGKEATWMEELKCFVHVVQYDPTHKFGGIMMLPGNCCSMSGAIAFFKRIDTEISSIMSYYPNMDSDTSYHKKDGEWIAIHAENRRAARSHEHLVVIK